MGTRNNGNNGNGATTTTVNPPAATTETTETTETTTVVAEVVRLSRQALDKVARFAKAFKIVRSNAKPLRQVLADKTLQYSRDDFAQVEKDLPFLEGAECIVDKIPADKTTGAPAQTIRRIYSPLSTMGTANALLDRFTPVTKGEYEQVSVVLGRTLQSLASTLRRAYENAPVPTGDDGAFLAELARETECASAFEALEKLANEVAVYSEIQRIAGDYKTVLSAFNSARRVRR